MGGCGMWLMDSPTPCLLLLSYSDSHTLLLVYWSEFRVGNHFPSESCVLAHIKPSWTSGSSGFLYGLSPPFQWALKFRIMCPDVGSFLTIIWALGVASSSVNLCPSVWVYFRFSSLMISSFSFLLSLFLISY